MPEQKEFDQRVQGIETTLRNLDTVSDPTRALAKELLQSVMDLHAAGLRRMLEMIFDKGDAGTDLIDDFGEDRLVGSLLLLYGFHPVELETRVGRALEKAAPVARRHGGQLELVKISGAVVTLRLHGIDDRAAAAAVKVAVDAEMYAAAPDVVSIQGLEMFGGPDFFPLTQLAAPSASSAR